jgi:uncharacterized protein YecE (DUF72 family)
MGEDRGASGRVRVGPAGWSSPDWEGQVYPQPKPRGFDPLAYLAQSFDIIEINSTFYRIPAATLTRSWATWVSEHPSFRFTIKLWQGLTHEAQAAAGGGRGLAPAVKARHALSAAGSAPSYGQRVHQNLWGPTRRRGTQEGREMALERLLHLEARIHESHDLTPQQKEELLQLLAELKEAMAELSTTHEAHAPSSTRVPDMAAAETTQQDTPQHSLRRAMDDVSTSVEAFEASHPELVNTVNQISTLLANMGI